MANEPDKSEQFERVWTSPSDHAGWWSVVNNQPLGKRYMVTAVIFFVVGGLLALLMRTQLAVPENTFLGPEAFNRLFTMHGSTMMFLFAVPFLEGLALYVIPLMLGTRDVAFPRLTAFGYWVYLFGGIIFYASFLVDAVPDTGWFSYTPLSNPEFSGLGMEFWLLGLSMVEIAGISAGLELVATILKLRAPGMSLNRLPIFGWAILVAGTSILFAFTTLLTATVLLELDFSMSTKFFHPDHGGSTLLWQHLFWIFGHPEVYIMFIPAAGIISTVVPVFARRPLAGYILVALSLVVTGFVGFGLWVHHMYTTGLPELSLAFFTVASFMVALASGTQVFAWIATLWGRKPALGNVSFLFVLGFFFLFVLGGITGVMVASVPFDWQVHDTYFIVAHFHYVIIGGVVFPIFAGLYYWLPKMTGRMLNERLGRWNFWLMFIGMNTAFFVMHLTGMQGMPRRVYTYSEALGLEVHNMISTVGAFIFGLGVLLFLVNVVVSQRRGVKAPDNPWNSYSTEWSIPSPPPIYSFFTPPVVRSRHPVWDQKTTDEPEERGEEAGQETIRVQKAIGALTGAPTAWRATLVTDVLTAEPQGIHRLPGPTYIPLLLALSVLASALGVLTDIYLLLWFGLPCAALTIFYWLWPDAEDLRKIRESTVGEQAELPVFNTGTRSPGWWGAVLFLAVLAVIFITMIFSYFYLRLYSEVWPQNFLSMPEIFLPGLATGLLLLSIGPMVWARRALRRDRQRAFQLGMGTSFMLGAAFLVLKMWVLSRVDFTPQTNAYGSVFFVIAGLMIIVTLLSLLMNGAVLYRAARGDFDRFNYLPVQVQITALFWYFTVAAGLPVYVTLYLSPYF